jgi:glucose/mannose transport system substrate-binding protein
MRGPGWRGLLAASVAMAAACGSEADEGSEGDAPKNDQIEIFSWWVTLGEQDALLAVSHLYEESHPGMHVVNAVLADAENSRETLAKRLEQGMPPDLYQENARAIAGFVAEHPDKLTPLNELYAQSGLREVLLPDLIEQVSLNGRIYAVPMGVHRNNSLFYNKQIFSDHEVTPPASIDELLANCAKLKAAGVTPIATSNQGWIQVLLFEHIHEGLLGAEGYKAYLDGTPAEADAQLPEATAVYAEIVENYINADAGDEGFGWDKAANLLYEGKAAMFIHGDWAKGLYTRQGWTSDVDFGVMGTPGSSDLFVYELDTWVMPAGGPNPQGARDFLEVAVSIDGQVAFDRLKGATSVRLDLPAQSLDSIGKEVLDSLETASVRVTSTLPDFSKVHEAFLKDHDQEKFVADRLALYEEYKAARQK